MIYTQIFYLRISNINDFTVITLIDTDVKRII